MQTDGQLKTGRDVVIAALLGAEEFGFATAPLVVSGCIMMRVCHLDTCPVGVATQNPVLRERFTGKPEFVVNFFEYIAEEVRELLAELGFRTLDEAIGQVETLDVDAAIDHWKASGLDLAPILHAPTDLSASSRARTLRCTKDPGPRARARRSTTELIAARAGALETGGARARPGGDPQRQPDRRHDARPRGDQEAYGGEGLPDGTIDITFKGSAGQSFGAFLPRGITLRLEGDANDYVGKGLSGGRIVVRPDRAATFRPDEQIIAGNVIGYGATVRADLHPRWRR